MRIAKLARLTPSELLLLVQAQVALLAAQLRVLRAPAGRLVARRSGQEQGAGDHPASSEPPPSAPTSLPRNVAMLALAVERAAENGIFRPRCLVRAVALERMLAARGIPGACVRVGVVMRNGRFAAHAWVELDGHVLGDREARVRRFAELVDAEVVRP